MNISNLGLCLNFFGAVLLGVTTQLGLAGGWGGSISWTKPIWKILNVLGWIFLSAGFLFQLLTKSLESLFTGGT